MVKLNSRRVHVVGGPRRAGGVLSFRHPSRYRQFSWLLAVPGANSNAARGVSVSPCRGDGRVDKVLPGPACSEQVTLIRNNSSQPGARVTSRFGLHPRDPATPTRAFRLIRPRRAF